MKLGMNMLLWSTDVTGPEYVPVFEMLRDAGYEGIEVPIFDTSPESVAGYERLGEQLAGLGFETLGVGARSGDDSPISLDPAVRERGLQATNAAVDICAVLGAKTICGPLGAPLGYFTGTGPTAEEQRHAVESLRAAAEHAATRDVTIVVEYLNRFEMYLINTAADTAALVREVDHPNCRMMYDTFHAHIEEKDNRRIPNTHLVMHGSSSVPQDLLAEIRQFGGDMKETYGVPVEEIQEAIKFGVRKIKIGRAHV